MSSVFASQIAIDTELGYFFVVSLNWMLNLQQRFFCDFRRHAAHMAQQYGTDVLKLLPTCSFK